MRVKLTFSYDGTAFYGFESQPDKRTVQGELCAALFKLYKAPVSVTPSGRTDAGVHALAQTVHYDTEKETGFEKTAPALNFYLPPDIRVIKAEAVPPDFHARRSAKRKTYRYDIYLSASDNPLLLNRAFRPGAEPDISVMRQAAELFVGEHDFKEFYCIGSSAKTTVRRVYGCYLTEHSLYGERVISLTVTANGFLYKMVRLIAGAVIAAGQGKLTPADIRAYLNGEKRNKKVTAPACGLYLVNVEY